MKTATAASSASIRDVLAPRLIRAGWLGSLVMLLATLSWAAWAPQAQAQTCTICDGSGSGKVDNLLLRYTGTTAITVQFNVITPPPQAGTLFGPATVQPGDLIFLERPGHSFGLGNAVEIVVNGTKIGEIHTSCSFGISVSGVLGNATYPFEVVAGGDQGNPDACGLEDLECSPDDLQQIAFTVSDDADSDGQPGDGDTLEFTFDIENTGTVDADDTEVRFYYSSARFTFDASSGGVDQDASAKCSVCRAVVFSGVDVGRWSTTPFSVTLVAATGGATLNATVAAEVALDTIDDMDSTPDNLGITVTNDDLSPGLTQDDECSGSLTLLPVELTSFDALLDGHAAELHWTTASETNNAGFEIQHQGAQHPFETIAFVAGHGTTLDAQHYHYRVDGLAPGAHRFRLKQIDFDGTSAYSPEIEVTVAMPATYFLSAVYPNPFNPEARLDFAVRQTQSVSVSVYNVLGQRVLDLYGGVASAGVTQSLLIDGRGLVSGLYMVRIVGERFVETRTFTMLQ